MTVHVYNPFRGTNETFDAGHGFRIIGVLRYCDHARLIRRRTDQIGELQSVDMPSADLLPFDCTMSNLFARVLQPR